MQELGTGNSQLIRATEEYLLVKGTRKNKIAQRVTRMCSARIDF